MISSKSPHFVRLARALAGRTHAAAALALFAALGSFAGTANADVLRFATGYPSQVATAGNPGLLSGAAFIPITTYSLTAFELTVTQQTRIDHFTFVGNTTTPGLYPFSVIVHSSLAALAANPLSGDIYSSTVWNINSQVPFGAGGGDLGMAWNYYTLTNPPGRDIVLNPGTYAITIYRDANWRFADSDIDLGTEWAANDSFPGQLFSWQDYRPSGTAAIDVYGTVLTPCTAPTITTQPQPATTCPTGAATFSVAADGTGPFTYQWQWRPTGGQFANVIDGVNTDPQGGPIQFTAAGARTGTVSIENTGGSGTANSHWEKRCIITNVCDTATSDPATLTICAADFNCDSTVDFFDYLDFVDAFSSQLPAADFNGDTVIDFFDYLDFVDAFSTGC